MVTTLKEVGGLTTVATDERPGCFLCGAKEGDGHWSGCTFAPEGQTADDDPDADGDFAAADRIRLD